MGVSNCEPTHIARLWYLRDPRAGFVDSVLRLLPYEIHMTDILSWFHLETREGGSFVGARVIILAMIFPTAACHLARLSGRAGESLTL